MMKNNHNSFRQAVVNIIRAYIRHFKEPPKGVVMDRSYAYAVRTSTISLAMLSESHYINLNKEEALIIAKEVLNEARIEHLISG